MIRKGGVLVLVNVEVQLIRFASLTHRIHKEGRIPAQLLTLENKVNFEGEMACIKIDILSNI